MPQYFATPISARECGGLFQGRERLDPAPGVVPLVTFNPPDECVIHCLARATAVNMIATEGASFIRSATFSKFLGVVAQIGGTTDLTTHRTDPAWDLAIQLTGDRVQLVAIPDFALETRWTWRLECTFVPIDDPNAPNAGTNLVVLPTF
jgi:hypothetical protein